MHCKRVVVALWADDDLAVVSVVPRTVLVSHVETKLGFGMSEKIHSVQSYPEILIEWAEAFLVVPPGLVEVSLATGASRYHHPTASVRLHVAVRVTFPSVLYRVDTRGPKCHKDWLAAIVENGISHAVGGHVVQTLQSLFERDDVTHWISVPDLQTFEVVWGTSPLRRGWYPRLRSRLVKPATSASTPRHRFGSSGYPYQLP